MSDGGFADFEDQDDGFEFLWDDEDESNDIADELAAHAIPSPVWQDDLSYETMHYYDGWDDLSDDDYFDHHPSGEAGSRGDSEGVERPSKDEIGRRGEVSTPIPSEIILGRNPNHPGHGRWIRGTVWKRPQGSRENEHVPGQDQRIALLQNWREVFRHSQPESDRLREEMHNKQRTEKCETLEKPDHFKGEGGANEKIEIEESYGSGPLTRRKRKAMAEPTTAVSRAKRVANENEKSLTTKRSSRSRRKGS